MNIVDLEDKLEDIFYNPEQIFKNVKMGIMSEKIR